jgi:polysaccharide deacetylase family protein (PEP-CTERM system associated)
MMTNNFLTFDIEEWYHANYDGLDIEKYKTSSTSLENTVDRLIDLCAQEDVKSTNFVLGELADTKPQIIKKLHSAGHEISSHGYAHKLVYDMKPLEFKEDLRISCDKLEQITGEKVLGFRAPSWSLKKDTLSWYYEILEEQGLTYSSSVYPAHTFLYGISGFHQKPHYPVIQNKQTSILEIPQSVVKILGKEIGFAGGFYLRFFPEWFIKYSIKNKNKNNHPVFVYLHPREIEKEQQKIDLKPLENFIHYHGINGCENKLQGIIKEFSKSFIRMDKFTNEMNNI